MTRRTDRVVRAAAGSGSFLDPPTYPTHEYGIVTDTNRRPENRGSASLTFALEPDCYLGGETIAQARRILAAWDRPPLDDERIRDWISQVLGYFRGCYRGKSGSWNASDLVITQDRDPLEHVDEHAGVHLVRKFYPEYVPTAEDFARAYWGTKPERVTS